jgi:hypothetical protein
MTLRLRAVAFAFTALALGAPGRAGASADPGRLPWLGLRLGGVSAVAAARGGADGAGGGGAFALFDAREFLADASLDLFLGDRTRVVAAGLGAYYPFLPGNVAPYAGGGVRAGWTKFGGDGTFGMIPYAAAGLMLGRNSYPQLRVELEYFLVTSRERATGVRGDGVRVHGATATFGLAF